MVEEAAVKYIYDAARKIAGLMKLPEPVSSDNDIQILLEKYDNIGGPEDLSQLFNEMHPQYNGAIEEKQQIEQGMDQLPETSRGKRYLLVENTYWYKDLLNILREEFR